MADPKKKNQAAFGCLFWIAFILLILVLFFIKKDTIMGVLEETAFFDSVFGTKTAAEKEAEEPVTDSSVLDIKREESSEEGPPAAAEQGPKTEDIVPPENDVPITVVQGPPETSVPEKPAGTQEQSGAGRETQTQTQTVPKDDVKTQKAQLFFINIDADGRVVRRDVPRTLPWSDSPMTNALNALFSGPTPEEAEKGLMSLIPPGSKLISATVQNKVAVLNLNDEFQFNQYGIQGYLGQLMQVVYTATAFPTVESVQIMIEGQRKEYLGAEGVWVGTPLTRNSF